MAKPTFDLTPDSVPNLVAQHIIATATGLKNLDETSLTNVISEVTIETQTAGASLLVVQLIDVDWRIQRSGLIDVDETGLLQQIDVNYPDGTDLWWRLAMVEGTSDLQGANLTLTFQERAISYLQADTGHLSVASGATTRAQFIKQLVDRIPHQLDPSVLGPGSPNSQKILFVCPELNVSQFPDAKSVTSSWTFQDPKATTTTTTVKGAVATSKTSAQVNKSGGIGYGAGGLTVKGTAISHSQIDQANILLGRCAAANAPDVVWRAIICAAIGESTLTALATPNSLGYWGTLQGGSGASGSAANFPPPSGWNNTAGMADSFLHGGLGFQGGGALALAKGGQTDPGVIATTVEASGKPGSFYGTYDGEAKAIVAAFGGIGASFSGGGTSGTSGTGNTSDVSQLARGDTNNPDEDSWTCIQRLASEVNWSVFTNPSPAHGFFGNYLYYADGPTIDAQMPTAYIELSDDGTVWSAKDAVTQAVVAEDGVISSLDYTFDNQAFRYQSSRKQHGKIARKSRVRTPQTPSQLKFNMMSGILNFCAGDVFVVQNAGPINGRWILENVTQNTLNDLFAQFTLGPPTTPNPEPRATSTSTSASSNASTSAGGTGAALAITSGTRMAGLVSEAATINNAHYPYVWGGGHASAGSPSGGGYDCSGCAVAVLVAGKLWASGSLVPADDGVISQLQSQGLITSGEGTGSPEVTLFDNPGKHIYMRLNGKYWGTWAQGSSTPGGGGWCADGRSGGPFQAYHFDPAKLNESLSGGSTPAANNIGGTTPAGGAFASPGGNTLAGSIFR